MLLCAVAVLVSAPRTIVAAENLVNAFIFSPELVVIAWRFTAASWSAKKHTILKKYLRKILYARCSGFDWGSVCGKSARADLRENHNKWFSME